MRRFLEQERFHGGGRCESRPFCRVHPLPAHFLYSKHNKKMFDLENEGQGHGEQRSYCFHSMENMKLNTNHANFVTFRQLSPYSRCSHFNIFDHEIVGQRYEVQHSQWRHSIANTGLPIRQQYSNFLHLQAFTCKNSHLTSLTCIQVTMCIFTLALTVWEILIFYTFDLENLVQAQGHIIRQRISTSIKVTLKHFSLAFTVFQILYIYIILDIL